MSISGGVDLALDRGKKAGCDAVQMFVKSSNQWKARPLREEEISSFIEKKKDYRGNFLMAHTSYLINLASPETAQEKKSVQALIIEVQRCETLDIPYLVLHPGSHKGSGEEAGIERIAFNLDAVLSATSGCRATILLETTAGMGNHIGYRFEHLFRIMDRLKDPSRAAVCYDTCHTFAAGYDIRTKDKYQAVFEEFDRVIGLEQLKAFHLNDSKFGLGTMKDRHQHIGKGKIGKKGFYFLVNDERFLKIPMVLETPKGPDYKEDRENLALLRSMRE